MQFYERCCAVVTGASSGLGMEFARQLAPYASSLVLVARRTERLKAIQQELGEMGGYCRDVIVR